MYKIYLIYFHFSKFLISILICCPIFVINDQLQRWNTTLINYMEALYGVMLDRNIVNIFFQQNLFKKIESMIFISI